MQEEDALRRQLDYYRARAAEYDQWWLREGRYDRGPGQNAAWKKEAAEVEAVLADFRPAGHVLEIACGTGNWTGKLLPHATRVTVLDGSPEMLRIHAGKIASGKIRRIEADLFKWQPEEKFDTVFFSFWLSHVPPERFDAFWELVRGCLAPGGRVFFIDSKREPHSTAVDHRLPEEGKLLSRRRLNDGREYEVYKIFHEEEELAARLGRRGWLFAVGGTERYFIHGMGCLPGSDGGRSGAAPDVPLPTR